MSNLTQVSPTRSQNVGFVLDWRVFARRLASEFDKCWNTHKAENLIRACQKKGG